MAQNGFFPSPCFGRALSKSTGVTLWMRTLPTPLTGALVEAGTTLFASTADGYVYAFNRLTGLVQWRNERSL